jgi:hypothetical protein
VTPYTEGDVAELRQLIADNRADQERDLPEHPPLPDGPHWFPAKGDRDALRGEDR